MKNRLTQRDDQGNWCVKGLPWEDINEGRIITKNTGQKIYGALCKLKDYEDAGLTPEQLKAVNEEYKELSKEATKYRWIPVTERLPDDDEYILVSFSNYPNPDIGKYEWDEEGGAFYPGDDETSYVKYGIFVNAWMPLPKNHKTTNEVIT